MDYSSSTNFMYARDLSIAYCARKMSLSLQNILETKRDDLLYDSTSILLGDELIYPIPHLFLDFLRLRDYLFPKAEKLFPTVNGNQYYPCSFHKRMQKILAEAGAKTTPSNPKSMSEEQLQALENMRFHIQRQRDQMVLAVTLCSFLGMRPSEVARLEKRDIDFGARLLRLRETKSQEDQKLPMLSILVQPLERYTSHLADSQSPLFVNNQGAKWERRDVAVAVSRYAAEHGIKNVTPQKLRATLGATLSRLKIEPALTAVILRHRDAATALRHYNSRELEDARQCLEGVKILTDAQLHQAYAREFDRMYTLGGG
jgi:hypothetical protein